MKVEKNWIPSIGEWVVVPKLFAPGEFELSQVTQRTRTPDGSEIWLWVDDRKFKLEHCKPVTPDVAMAEYQKLLERCAAIGELADRLTTNHTYSL